MKRGAVMLATLGILGLPACGNGSGATEASPAVATEATEASPTATSEPTGVPSNRSDGRIVFSRYDGSADAAFTYTMNPDGTDLKPLFTDGPSEVPQVSPDGSEIGIFCCDDGMVAHLVDADTGRLRELPPLDATLETHCGFAWSPDGDRLACEVFGVDDPSGTGIYSIRASDGGDLTRITSNPGGDDIPGDYSPDGTRMVFARVDGKADLGVFVTNLDGTGLRKLSADLVEFGGGRWSPTGDQILFPARRNDDHHKAVWIVNADGSSLHQLSIDPRCGGLWSDPQAIGCYSPTWSPDGTQIAYVRSTPGGDDAGIYIANADGSGSVRLTDGEDDEPHWGTYPTT